ncbi:MAG: energy-coupling factor transporter transmembrane protein EcfT [Candidatus Altiarchaeota archaeon]|nr:energy-coupling factor transporter transmembrane protein EcfT [Candidatus Altiarchaeota archaeon]
MRAFFYRHKDTRFHNLNPMAKFLTCAAIIALALLSEYPAILLVLLIVTLAIAIEARIGEGWLFYARVGLWTGVFIVALNLILSQGGDTVLFQARLNIPLFETLRITLESIVFGLIMALRLIVVISAFAVMSLTISPREMLHVMSAFRVPSRSVFLVSLAIRFVPSLLEDMDTLMDVQRARGAKLKGIRGKGPVIIPLLSNSLERSVSVAEAMEARGLDYDDGDKRA